MDILFSPYGVGGMPKATIADIERTTEELLKSSSFQRMLDLENKYKMQRLRSPQFLLPSPQLPNHPKDGPPPRPERPDTLFPQDAFLMVKATRRPAIPPSLSITIPQNANNERRCRPSERAAEQEDDEDADGGTPTNSEPFQKQVKFLAPEDGDEGEDGMSEQSSICQSPSWEGYGQRKKEKKLEAERRKREKEQADKEAKVAKKRATARLSKAPPPPPPVAANRNSRAAGLTTADRSMSDPLLVSRHLLQSSQSIRPEDVGRTASADDLQQTRWHRLAASKALSDLNSNTRGTGGGTMEGLSSSTIPHQLLYDNGFAPRQELRRSISEGPAPLPQLSPSASSAKHESRAPRDAFPPSASRTPRLRHMSPSGGRSSSLYQGATSANNSQESLSATPTADGARRNGYVQYQRAQAAERAMAGLADEELVEKASQHYPPSSSSYGQSQHARRPSLSQEAKSAAMKLVGIKPAPSAKDDTAPTDYLTFKAIPYSSSDIDASVSAGSMNGRSESSTVLERPPTSQSSVSSSDPSVAGSAPSNSKKGRSLKDAAKAALSAPKAPQKPVDSPKPPISVPPYLRFRSRMHSRTSVRVENKTSHATAEPAPEFASNSTVVVSVADQAKPTDMVPQEGSRASEGSSSSSAYDDGSPLPSPTTTPDTSRPQSAKDIPLFTSELAKQGLESVGLQDDQQTLRQSLDSSKSSTPRMSDAETRESFETGREDRWSRTALPIDIDGDAQSFMTTVSNFDNVDDAEQMASHSPSSPHAKTATPEPLNLVSKANLHTDIAGPPISIPPRSRKRNHSSPGRSPVAPPSPAEQKNGDVGAPQSMMEVPGQYGEAAQIGGPPSPRISRNFTRPFEQPGGKEKKDAMPEGYKKFLRKPTRPLESEPATDPKGGREEHDGHATVGSPQRDWTSGSTSSASSIVPSAGPASPHALTTDFQIPNNPYFVDFPEPHKYHGTSSEIPTSAGPPSPMSLPSPLHQVPPKPPAQPRANSAPIPSLASTTTSRASTPSARASGTMPVSILKHPKTPTPENPTTTPRPVLSALPKHMQLQAGTTRPPPGTGTNTNTAPIAKMLVECCSCRFFHDMPSKLYECMARPDAVVEDRLLGISGAITTMVKCPWCQHNMSRECCAGYAAFVYLREKLH